MKGRIIVVGSSNTDMVIRSPVLPSPGETVLGGRFIMSAGGKGANQAVAASRLGANVLFIARVGQDMFGQKAMKDLAEEGIDTKYMVVDPDLPSGIALIMVDEDGQNCISVASGANGALGGADVDRSAGDIAGYHFMLVQLEVPLPTVVRAVSLAAALKLKVILNPAPACVLPDDLYHSLYLITPNETEATILTGIRVVDITTAKRAAATLKSKGVEHVIITLGSEGAFIFDDDGGRIIRAQKVKAVDSTAAGDTFNGALAVALSEGNGLDESVSFANEAAALSVMKLGAQSSIPYRKELEHR